MFPNANHGPSSVLKHAICVAIALHVLVQLAGPPLPVRGWRSAMLGASMPEAPVDEHRDVCLGESDVSAPTYARDYRNVDAVSQPETMKLAA